MSDIEDLIKLAKKRDGNSTLKLKNKRSLHEEEDYDDKTNDIIYPYPVVADDHCETPVQAYEDISNFLNSFAVLIGKTKETLLIYDPFYCEGSVVSRLNSLGFKNVYNVKEDFYEVCKSMSFPNFDVIVTNPPYSGAHMEHIVKISIESGKPWFLLMPNYVYKKDYYEALTRNLEWPVFYVTPASKRRYLYTTPKVR